MFLIVFVVICIIACIIMAIVIPRALGKTKKHNYRGLDKDSTSFTRKPYVDTHKFDLDSTNYNNRPSYEPPKYDWDLPKRDFPVPPTADIDKELKDLRETMDNFNNPKPPRHENTKINEYVNKIQETRDKIKQFSIIPEDIQNNNN